ncbi:MAG: hypothetical protein GX102_14785 [Porphyromonadaceae bacterium]|nr:hypothetical protein [Porphyromonadaceae bacterium]
MNEALILALKISGIGIAGVFLFMTLFYFVIIGIDKLFPPENKMKQTSGQSGDSYEDEFH